MALRPVERAFTVVQGRYSARQRSAAAPNKRLTAQPPLEVDARARAGPSGSSRASGSRRRRTGHIAGRRTGRTAGRRAGRVAWRRAHRRTAGRRGRRCGWSRVGASRDRGKQAEGKDKSSDHVPPHGIGAVVPARGARSRRGARKVGRALVGVSGRTGPGCCRSIATRAHPGGAVVRSGTTSRQRTGRARALLRARPDRRGRAARRRRETHVQRQRPGTLTARPGGRYVPLEAKAMTQRSHVSVEPATLHRDERSMRVMEYAMAIMAIVAALLLSFR